jgi:hypothetical protein
MPLALGWILWITSIECSQLPTEGRGESLIKENSDDSHIVVHWHNPNGIRRLYERAGPNSHHEDDSVALPPDHELLIAVFFCNLYALTSLSRRQLCCRNTCDQ